MIIHCKQKDTTHASTSPGHGRRRRDLRRLWIASPARSSLMAEPRPSVAKAAAIASANLQDLRDSNQVYDLKPQ